MIDHQTQTESTVQQGLASLKIRPYGYLRNFVQVLLAGGGLSSARHPGLSIFSFGWPGFPWTQRHR